MEDFIFARYWNFSYLLRNEYHCFPQESLVKQRLLFLQGNERQFEIFWQFLLAYQDYVQLFVYV